MASNDGDAAAIIKRSYLAWVTMQFRTADAAVENLRQAITAAHEWGASWRELGEAMGMTGQAAHKRFGPPSARRRPPSAPSPPTVISS